MDTLCVRVYKCGNDLLRVKDIVAFTFLGYNKTSEY